MNTKREKLEGRYRQLKQERSSWEEAWRDITEQMVPYRTVWGGQWVRNKGDKKESKIINNTPVRALRTLSAGLMAGITSPARQWFNITIPDRDLAESKNVKLYLDRVRKQLEAVLQADNWYNALSNGTYLDLGSIGTSAMFIDEEPPTIGMVDGEARIIPRIMCRPLPIGEYYLDADENSRVDVCIREIQMSVRQAVRKFGYENCSKTTKDHWDHGNYNQNVLVFHAVMPNDEYEKGHLGPQGKPFASQWWEAWDERKDGLNHEGGYEEFPVLAPRWFTRPGDVYGRGPGWEVRGDCRALQHKERRLAVMFDKTVNPPMKGSQRIKRASILAGDFTEVPGGKGGMYEPAMLVSPQSIQTMLEHIHRDEVRIEEAMLVDLFRNLLDDRRAERPTATEVDAREREKLLLMGPALENFNSDLLGPCIDRKYRILYRHRALPEAPKELEGMELQVEFISVMHQAQQQTAIVGIQTFVNGVGTLSQVWPEARDKVNVDVLVDEYASVSGVRPDAVLSKDEVNQARQAQAQMQQEQQQKQDLLAATQGIKNVSGADPQTLQQVAGALSPAAAAQGAGL